MAQLVLYGSSVSDATLTTACDMAATITGGVETSTLTTFSGGSGFYGEIFSKGGTSSLQAAISAPTGNGFAYKPGAGTFALGNWSAVFAVTSGVGGTPADITMGFWKYSGGSYTSIGSIVNSSPGLTTSVRGSVTFGATSMPTVTFAASDILYIDLWWHDPSGIGGENPTLWLSNSSTVGVVGDVQVTTASFTASLGFPKLLYMPYATPRALGGTIIPQVILPPVIYEPRALGSTLLTDSRIFVPRALGGTYIQDDPTKLWVPRALGGTTQVSTRVALSSTHGGVGTISGAFTLSTALSVTMPGLGVLTGAFTQPVALTSTFSGVGSLLSTLRAMPAASVTLLREKKLNGDSASSASEGWGPHKARMTQTPNGDVYVGTRTGDTSFKIFKRDHTAGTWGTSLNNTSTTYSSDPEPINVVVFTDGSIHAISYSDITSPATVTHWYSTDNGSSWSHESVSGNWLGGAGGRAYIGAGVSSDNVLTLNGTQLSSSATQNLATRDPSNGTWTTRDVTPLEFRYDYNFVMLNTATSPTSLWWPGTGDVDEVTMNALDGTPSSPSSSTYIFNRTKLCRLDNAVSLAGSISLTTIKTEPDPTTHYTGGGVDIIIQATDAYFDTASRLHVLYYDDNGADWDNKNRHAMLSSAGAVVYDNPIGSVLGAGADVFHTRIVQDQFGRFYLIALNGASLAVNPATDADTNASSWQTATTITLAHTFESGDHIDIACPRTGSQLGNAIEVSFGSTTVATGDPTGLGRVDLRITLNTLGVEIPGGVSLAATMVGSGTFSPSAFAEKTALTITVQGAGTLVPTMSLATALTATLPGIGTLTGSLSTSTNVNLAVTISAVGTVTMAGAALSTTLATTIPAVGVLNPALTASMSLASLSIPAVGTLVGTLGASAPLSSTVAGVGTLSATMAESTSLTRLLSAVGTLTGTLTVGNSVSFAGTIPAVGTLTASAPGLKTALTVSIVALGIIGPGATFSEALTGTTLVAVGILSGSVSLSVILGATLPGAGTISGAYQVRTALSLQLMALGALVGTIRVPATFFGPYSATERVSSKLASTHTVTSKTSSHTALSYTAVRK